MDNSRGQASLRAQPPDGRADGFCALEGRAKNGAKPGSDQIPPLRAFSGRRGRACPRLFSRVPPGPRARGPPLKNLASGARAAVMGFRS